MSNDELIAEHRDLRRRMKELEKAGKLAERNALVPRILELNEQVDWGFRPGDVVEQYAGRKWEEDEILRVDGSRIHFASVILPPSLVRKKQEQLGQLSLF